MLPSEPAPVPSGTTVREIAGNEHGVFAAALASGFGMPRGVADVFARPALLDAPGITAFVLEVDGEAVATGLNIMAGDKVGMYNGAVPPQHRGNGYYRSLVTARLRHVVDSGARYAFTQKTRCHDRSTNRSDSALPRPGPTSLQSEALVGGSSAPSRPRPAPAQSTAPFLSGAC
jgi:predicted GNAT family acetyltransferase